MRRPSMEEEGIAQAKPVNSSSHVESPRRTTPIAIIGMSCRFGGNVSNTSSLWKLLTSGSDAWSPIPKDRFDARALYHPDQQRRGRHHVKGGYFLSESVTSFDAPFFSLSTEAASAMDPQLRLLMEGVYEAVENAGVPIEKLSGSDTSVFAASFGKDYQYRLMKDPETLPASFMTGNEATMLANRISHFYNLKGPSATITTGCSGGMAALHFGIQSIRSGECGTALVGASNLLLNPDFFIALSDIGVLSSDGRCYSWDDRAEGYGRGEGVAVLVLKSLDHAIRDNDFVHAVIRESAINQDGWTSTITSPSMQAQQKLIQDCYRRAGLNLSETSYVEAHMTGTATGDPIEAETIAQTFGKARAHCNPILVGSVKPSIGHTEPVSGLASIIKTALILQHRLIPANANYSNPKPQIPLATWNLAVPTSLTSWPEKAALRASINNFGYGGTNAHVILEGYIRNEPPAMNEETDGHHSTNGTNNRSKHSVHSEGRISSYLFVISSKDSSGTLAMAKNLSDYISHSMSDGRDLRMTDLAYSLAERRSRFLWTTVVRANSLSDLVVKLEDSHRKPIRALATIPRIGYVFNGQGAQWYAMGRELLYTYPVFRTTIQRADEVLREVYHAPWSLREELLRDEKSTRVHDVELSQPLSVALQISLVDLLSSWNIVPSAVVSHSSGEIAAAYAAGAITFVEALGIVYYRGHLASKFQKVAPQSGGMMAANLTVEEANEYLQDISSGKVVIACVNSPSSVTFSGDLPALDELRSTLEDDGVFARRLRVPLAYHSHHMKHMAEEYKDALQTILSPAKRDLRTVFASPVTGDFVTSAEDFGPEHWVRNLVSPVQFSKALERMVLGPVSPDKSPQTTCESTNVDILVEIGAHDTLSGPIRQTLKDQRLPYLSCLRRSVNAVDTMQDVACDLIGRGVSVTLKDVNMLDHHEVRYVHDLPLYVWNHNSEYMFEPRLSREHRFKRTAPHELLGTLTPAVGKNAATWRNFLRIEDVPWLIDHQLESRAVLPGAGFVSMATEAVRLIKTASPAKHSLSGFQLRDITIKNALIIPPDTGIEIVFSLQESSEKDLDHKDWYDFKLFSVSTDDAWILHCDGQVRAETTARKPTIDSEITRSSSESYFAPGTIMTDVPPHEVFASLRKMDFYHGPAFQNLIDSRLAGSRSITEFDMAPVALASAEDYALHPTTLGSIFQACYVCLPSEAKEGAMMVPHFIGSMLIPADFGRHPGHKLEAYMDLLRWSDRGAEFDGYVHAQTSDITGSSVLRLTDFHLQRVRQVEEEIANKAAQLHARVQWDPDISYRIPSSLTDDMKIWLNDTELEFERNVREAAYHFIKAAVHELSPQQDEDWQWYHKRYFSWMQKTTKLAESGQLLPGSEHWQKRSEESKLRLFETVDQENAAGQLTSRMGRHLPEIVRGEITPLELMMDGGLLHKYYQELPNMKDRSVKHLRKLMELYAVKEPGARVLEIGGGTGGATKDVLEAFSSRAEDGSGSLLGHYDFTDVSTGFFPAAKDKFAAWQGLVDFKKLDIEIEPVQQGFTTQSYDLIVAAQVLHATTSLDNTLKNVRKLLKPTGKLVLLESTQDSLDIQLAFGTLPGWWLSQEPERNMSPNVSAGVWDKVLKANGFSGVDIEIRDCEQEEVQVSSVMVTTARGDLSFPPAVSIVHHQRTPQDWFAELKQAISDHTGSSCNLEPFRNLKVQSDRIYVLALDLETTFLDCVSQSDFERLRDLLVSSSGILWMSCANSIDSPDPFRTTAQGLLRTLRREDLNKRYVYLDLESTPDPWTEENVNHVVHVFKQSFNHTSTEGDMDMEYAVKDSTIHVPRIYPNMALDKATTGSGPQPELQNFQDPGRRVEWQVPEGGDLNEFLFVEQSEAVDNLPENMVEIEARVFGLNFQDVMTATGLLGPTKFVAHESAGVIRRVGIVAERAGLQVGDRVCGVFQGRFANISRALWTSVVQIPDSMAFEEAASLPYAYGTTHIGLHHVGRLNKGDRVLIHSAAGGVGQAAVNIAQRVGAEVFVTCGTKEKRELLMRRFGIQPDHIFSSRDASFASGIMAATQGQGVDIALNSLAGPLLKATWECMARFGRFVEIGKVDLEAGRLLNMSNFNRGVTYVAIDLIQYCQLKGPIVQRALIDGIDCCRNGSGALVSPITKFSISELGDAIKHMQKGVHMGKLIIQFQPEDQVQVLPQQPRSGLDDSGETHLVVGGMGGVGLAIATKMMEKGCKNLVVTSRHATSSSTAASLRRKAEETGCNLFVRDCDVSDETSLLELISSLKTLPPIRGVIQGAMVLDDTVFERMSYEKWLRAIRPKVAGTMNLHKHFNGLRYFIMLSSGTGIFGNVSQANYTAGGTFQDAMARWRTANGLPATSIDLGQISDVGYVAKGGDDVRNRLEKTLSSITISIDHVFTLVERAICNPRPRNVDDSQILTCIAKYQLIADDAGVKADKRFGTLRLGDTGKTANDKAGANGAPSSRSVEALRSLMSMGPTVSDDPAKATELTTTLLAAKIAELFNVDPERIDASLPLTHHGIDSLVAVQFRNWLSSAVKARVSIFDIMQATSLTELAATVAGRSALVGGEAK